jgi:carotenoid 1,2-hydratase
VVPSGGYVWWYVDALSDDGRHGLTLIAFVGSVFSPYYARARRRGAADPEDHCALNVALYGAGGKRWALTERGRRSVRRERTSIAIGPSALAWDGRTLTVAIDEVTVPVPAPIRGRVRVEPTALPAEDFALDCEGRHRWRPIAPTARIEVTLERPALRWSGHAYLDSNQGDAPLEDAFAHWQWSRGALPDGSTVVLYDVARRAGAPLCLALRCGPDGRILHLSPPAPAALPGTLWRVARATRADPGAPATVVATLEDAPFYARSLVAASIGGEPVTWVHESLSLDRFRRRWVQVLLPFRMPRRSAW